MRNVYLLALALMSCTPVQIKDHIVYGDEGRFGAVKVHTLFTNIQPVQVPKDQWDVLRVGMACLAADDLADVQNSVDVMCTRHTGECDYQTQVMLAKAKLTVHRALIAAEWSGVKLSDKVKKAFTMTDKEMALAMVDPKTLPNVNLQ